MARTRQVAGRSTRTDGVRVGIALDNQGYSSTSQRAWTWDEGAATVEVKAGVYSITISEAPVPYLPPDALRVAVGVADTTVSLVLKKGLRLSGRLIDDSGEMIDLSGRVSVGLHPADGGASYTARLSLGPASFDVSIRPGEYRCTLQAGYSGSAAFTVPSQELSSIVVTADTSVDFTVDLGVSVSGYVRGVRGSAASYGSVYFDSQAGSGSADLNSEGFFVTRLLPGQYSVQARFFGTGDMPPWQNLGMTDIRQDTVLEWRLLDDELVEGTVLDIHGEGVAGLRVVASRSGDSLSVHNNATTRDDGSYAIRLPPGSYSVEVGRSELGVSSVYWRLRDLEVPSVFPPVHTLPGGASLLAEFVDPDGGPVGARLQVRDGPYNLREPMGGRPVINAYAETGGLSEIKMTPGRYSALVSSNPGGPTPQYVRVVSDLLVEDLTELLVTIPHAGGAHRLSGSVTAGEGGLPGPASLYAYEPDQGLLVTVTVRDGRYEVLLPVGEYQIALRVTSPDAGEAIHEFGPVVVDGDQTWNIDLDAVTSIADSPSTTPDRSSLEQNYPNPFNAGTVIPYTV